jgi:hypothetical protein
VVKVIEVEGDRVKIHFQGWAARWEEWVEVSSDRLAPHKTKSMKEARAKAAAVEVAKKEAADAAKARAKAEREAAKAAAKAAAKRRAAEERLAAQVMSPPQHPGLYRTLSMIIYTVTMMYPAGPHRLDGGWCRRPRPPQRSCWPRCASRIESCLYGPI